MKKTRKLLCAILAVSAMLSSMMVPVSAAYKNGRYIQSTITFIPYSGFGATSIAHFNTLFFSKSRIFSSDTALFLFSTQFVPIVFSEKNYFLNKWRVFVLSR